MDSKAAIALVAALATGCTTITLPPIKEGEQVAFVAAGATGPPRLDLYNNAMGQSAGTGAATGAFTGAMWAFACGPWFLVCMPITALFGSGVGALTGTAVGAMQGPDAGTREQLIGRMRSLTTSRNVEGELSASIATLAGGRWRAAGGNSVVSVVTRVDEVALHARRGDRAVLAMKVTVAVRGVPAGSEQDWKTFEYLGPEADLRVWIEDRADFISESLDHAIRHIARQAYSELSR